MKKLKSKLTLNFFLVLLSGVIFFGLGNFALASDISSSSFIIRDPIVGAGGGFSTSSSFRLFGSQDTLFTDYNNSLNFIGEYGFLYFPSTTSTPTPTPTPGGGGGGIRHLGPTECARIADFNCDDAVDLLDLSIFLFWMDESGPVPTLYDLNSDGELDLKDISIIFYYWDEN